MLEIPSCISVSATWECMGTTHDIFYVSQPVCNQQLKNMLGGDYIFPTLLIIYHWPTVVFQGLADILLQRHPRTWTSKTSWGVYTRICLYSRGRAIGGSLGYANTSKFSFVAFIGRDPAYLEGSQPYAHWGYHSYRDMDIRILFLRPRN